MSEIYGHVESCYCKLEHNNMKKMFPLLILKIPLSPSFTPDIGQYLPFWSDLSQKCLASLRSDIMHKCYGLWNIILDQSKTIPDITKFLVIYEKLQMYQYFTSVLQS